MGKTNRKSIWSEQTPEPVNTETGWGDEKALSIAQPLAPVPVVEQLRLTEKKSRDRSWERQEDNRTILFRRVPPGLRDAIGEVANNLHVRVDDVARAFLEFGLLCYQKGDIQIRPVLSDGRLTLFPKPDNRRGKSTLPGWYEKAWEQQPPVNKISKVKRSTSDQEKPWKWQVSYRGIPAELQTALREIHSKKTIPLGEVATLFLGHSLDAFLAGRLVLNPQPRKQAGISIDITQVG